MADSTYGPKVYFDQGGNRLNVVAGGTLVVESGSTLTVASSLTTSGNFIRPTETGSTGTAFVNFGITRFGSTLTTKTFTLAAPVAGVEKILYCTQAGATSECWVDCSTGVTAFGKRYLEFNLTGDSVTMIGRSATVWDIVNNVGSVASATSTTG